MLVVFLSFSLLVQPAWSFGTKGHHLVGKIADRLLAGKPVSAKIALLLDGISLEQAAVIPDQIKSWDQQPSMQPGWEWSMKPTFRQEMTDFLLANSNPPGGHGHNPDHHNFHYTDISVVSDLKYSLTKTGSSDTDVVQMINYCIGVLQGINPPSNPRNITPRVAVVLLAHYVGDMHQPLHVGAAYFDGAANKVDPDMVAGARQDKGGNDIQLHLNGSTSNSMALHAFWDNQSVEAAFFKIKMGPGDLTQAEIDSHFVTTPPPGAPLDNGVAITDLSAKWADEILPIAQDVHNRLTMTALQPPVHSGHYTFRWKGTETTGTTSYKAFAGGVVDTSIHRAGWRLAALLEQLL